MERCVPMELACGRCDRFLVPRVVGLELRTPFTRIALGVVEEVTEAVLGQVVLVEILGEALLANQVVGGDLDRGLALLSEAQRIYAELGEPYGEAWVNRYLGLSHQERGNLEEAISLQSRSLDAFREAGDTWNIRFSQTLLGEAMHTVSNLPRARELYDESLRGPSDARFKVVIAHALKGLGKVSLAEEKPDEAVDDLNEALKALREIGDVACVAETKGHLAMVNLGRGHLVVAADLLVDSLGILRGIEDQGGVAWCLERMASVAAASELFERAAQLVGAQGAIRTRSGSKRPPVDEPDYERLVSRLRAELGADGFSTQETLGAGLNLDEAVALGVDI